ncbi:MAG: hypothetical protein ACW99U_16760 [Candidatus Thorarchaeota archaeon]|jgi:hypothetical protein
MTDTIVTAVVAISTTALAIVTYWYAKNTKRMLGEARKQKEIEHLEMQLSRLYSPLTANPNRLTQWPPFSSANPRSRGYDAFWESIRSNIHLGSDDLREALLEFIWAIDNESHPTAQKKATKYRKIVEDIAVEEFDEIRDKLISLVSS